MNNAGVTDFIFMNATSRLGKLNLKHQ